MPGNLEPERHLNLPCMWNDGISDYFRGLGHASHLNPKLPLFPLIPVVEVRMLARELPEDLLGQTWTRRSGLQLKPAKLENLV